ncbi:MAG: hypothetical protein ABSH56_27930 [Bryobacteraceae bacterium]
MDATIATNAGAACPMLPDAKASLGRFMGSVFLAVLRFFDLIARLCSAKSPALMVIQAQSPIAELLTKHTVLFAKVVK